MGVLKYTIDEPSTEELKCFAEEVAEIVGTIAPMGPVRYPPKACPRPFVLDIQYDFLDGIHYRYTARGEMIGREFAIAKQVLHAWIGEKLNRATLK